MTKPADGQIAKGRERYARAEKFFDDNYDAMDGLDEISRAVRFAESERQAVIEECCRAVCSECRKGDVPERFYAGSEGGWYHTMLGFDDRTERCAATAIRSMWE